MMRGIRFLSRAFAIAMLLSAGMIPPAHSSARTPANINSTPDTSVARYEVRLRKLHLVRPDLIGYPVFYDVYC
ncbi:MAG TPA: hypothetical protein VH475_22695 [Tepidisphaeraceae bacterium]|jgi:hypothetical protein